MQRETIILLILMSWLNTVAAAGQDKEFHYGKKERTKTVTGEAALPAKTADSQAKHPSSLPNQNSQLASDFTNRSKKAGGLGVSLATLQRLHANLKVEYSAPGNNYPLDVIAIGNLEAMNLQIIVRGPAQNLSSISIECKMPTQQDIVKLSAVEGERFVQLSIQGLLNVITYTMIIICPADSMNYNTVISQQVKEATLIGSSTRMLAGNTLSVVWASSLNKYSVLIKPAE